MTPTYVIRGKSMQYRASFYDSSDALADLTAAPTFTLYDSNGAVVTTGTATKVSTGIYKYIHAITTDGDYTFEFSGTRDSMTLLGRGVILVRFVV